MTRAVNEMSRSAEFMCNPFLSIPHLSWRVIAYALFQPANPELLAGG